jgi:carbonic anhydrase
MCGAVTATVDELERPSETRSPNLHSIVERIKPVVAPLMESEHSGDRDALISRAVRANIRSSVSQVRHGSRILEKLAEHGLMVVGAEYDLESGVVSFFDDA